MALRFGADSNAIDSTRAEGRKSRLAVEEIFDGVVDLGLHWRKQREK